MGISFSSNRRRNNNNNNNHPYYQNPPPPPPPPQPHYLSNPHYYSDPPSFSPPPPPPPRPPPPPEPSFSSSSASSSSSVNYPEPNSAIIPYAAPRAAAYQAYPLPLQPPPPPQPPQTHYCYGQYNSCNQMMGRYSYNQNYQPYYGNQVGGWPAMRPPVAPVQPPPPYVEHQNAKKVKNDVNVHKDTLRVEIDEQNPDQHLVSFVFDALYDGSITILYFAKEETDCRFVPLFPEAFTPVVVPFQKGVGQKFRQPSGTGIDLGFFELDDLSKPSPAEDVFPLVISAETCSPPDSVDHIDEPVLDASPRMQITQAVLEKNNDDPFQVKVIKQILWIDEVRYELREIYGIATSAVGFDDNDPGKECVICMTEPKDTAVLPCRHMCMCSDCAKELRIQSNKCPICRQPIEELIEIKMNKS